jgi:hypothetical protein
MRPENPGRNRRGCLPLIHQFHTVEFIPIIISMTSLRVKPLRARQFTQRFRHWTTFAARGKPIRNRYPVASRLAVSGMLATPARRRLQCAPAAWSDSGTRAECA